MKFLITGHGRHGKDTVCEILKRDYGLSFISSSEFAGKKCVWPIVGGTWEECFNSRHQNRKLWFDLIEKYNSQDKSRLAREILEKYDIYCGLRNIKEFNKVKDEKLFDHTIWIDASERVPPESSDSMTIKSSDCDWIIYNNSSIEDLEKAVALFVEIIGLENKN